MTNKANLISVPRELLENLIAKAYEEKPGNPDYEIDELRRLLAAPAEDVRAVVDEPAPIGKLYRDCYERIVFEAYGEIHVKDGMNVFSHPQRETVMPERELYTKYLSGVIPGNADTVNAYKDGWNACLDEFKRLNP